MTVDQPELSTSLGRKLVDFSASLPDEERQLFFAILAVAATSEPEQEEPEVEGHTFRATRNAGGFGPDAELSMIALQSLVSQRSQAVQLTTNMMSKFNQSTMSIICNIR